jgi:hypothetical protein
MDVDTVYGSEEKIQQNVGARSQRMTSHTAG